MFLNSTNSHSYYQQLPEDIPSSVSFSAGSSFIVSLVLTCDFKRAMFASGFAATASLVNAFATPFFKEFFHKDYLDWYLCPFRPIVSLKTTEILMRALGPYTSYHPDIHLYMVIVSIFDAVTVYVSKKPVSLNSNATFILY